MINNRQNGRRRGRGGQPQRNGLPGAPDRGNRLDNRARGNANQLHEKYKTLARDAQMQGDRVTTEYYLQFADHYFRVLSESRARFEEQRRPRDDYRGQNEGFDDGYDASDEEDGEEGFEAEGSEREDRPAREGNGRYDQRDQRDQRNDGQRDDRPRNDASRQEGQRGDGQRRYRDQDGGQRDYRGGDQREGQYRESQPRNAQPRDAQSRDAQSRDGGFRDERPRQPRYEQPRGLEGQPVAPEGEERPARQPRRRAERTNGHAGAHANGAADAVEAPRERIEIDRLPPAFAATPPADEPAEAVAEKPRRRTRRPRADAVEAEA